MRSSCRQEGSSRGVQRCLWLFQKGEVHSFGLQMRSKDGEEDAHGHAEGRTGLVAQTLVAALLSVRAGQDSDPTKHSCRAGRRIFPQLSPLLH